MAITNYAFYTTIYNGDSVSESSFAKYETRAESKLIQLLGGNSITNVEFNVEIQMAICQLVDLLFAFDIREQKPNDINNTSVKSMSSGGQSVTFNNNSTVIDEAASDITKQDRFMLDKITPYLYSTGLLYKGVM